MWRWPASQFGQSMRQPKIQEIFGLVEPNFVLYVLFFLLAVLITHHTKQGDFRDDQQHDPRVLARDTLMIQCFPNLL